VLAAATIGAAVVAELLEARDVDLEDAMILALDLRKALARLYPPEREMIQLRHERGPGDAESSLSRRPAAGRSHRPEACRRARRRRRRQTP